MTTHTPPPWTLLAENEMTIVVASAEPRIDDRAFGIAIIPHHKEAMCIPWTTKEANARLISAAPDLLAALIAAIEFADIIEPYTEEEAVFLAMTNAAIEKATTGGES